MSVHRRWIVGTVALLTLAAFTALPVLVGGQPAGLRFVAERQGPQGTVILLNNCDASATPKGAAAGKFMPDNADCIINGEEDRKQLEPIRIRPPSRAAILRRTSEPCNERSGNWKGQRAAGLVLAVCNGGVQNGGDKPRRSLA